MQAVWLAFDEIAGKGIDLFVVLKFLGYLSLTVVPLALPIAILLSSIMALGTLSENYEFAAMKSAGISLGRVIRPLIIFVVLLSMLNFLFLNNVFPWAKFKQINFINNLRQQTPALALIPGVFNTNIDNFSIKFDEKYGEDDNLLKNVQIADLSSGLGKLKVITAKKGIISSEEGSKYMAITLLDGNYYEEHLKNRMKKKEKEKMPASNASFDKYIINIDISKFQDDDKLDDEKIKAHYAMFSIVQLDSISKKRKESYDKLLNNKTKLFYNNLQAKKLYKYQDTLIDKDLQPEILDNFILRNKNIVLSDAIQSIKRIIDRDDKNRERFKNQRKLLNLYDFEFSYRFSFALACLVLFFVGAPLGSIIRKGGFGIPMILAITIFVVYFFISQLGKNMAEESAITTLFGSWLSTMILLPLGVFLTRRATVGMSIFNLDSFFNNFKQVFLKMFKK